MSKQFDKVICVVGLGYIGLPTATVLAARGYNVIGVDVNPRTIETINSGRAHVVEPDLDILVKAAVQTGRLRAQLTPVPADIFIICVPTPVREHKKPDLSYVHKAAESICPYVKPGNLVILESTSPPGTTEEIAAIIERHTDLKTPQVRYAHAPERVLPGKILREVVENDRVIGGIDADSAKVCAEFYGTFVTGKLHLTDCRTAETVKLVENAYRDVNIAFANELSMLADELNIDVWELISLANRHPRVNILTPGCGVGGHCIAVDPWFLVDRAPGLTNLIRTARGVNDRKPHWVLERIRQHAERFKRPVIACLGLAYKPNIDDLRESPAAEIAMELVGAEIGEVRVVEPNIPSHPEFRLMGLEQALDGADIVVVLVAHDQFKSIPPKLLHGRVLIDTTGMINGMSKVTKAAESKPRS
jgi:UDP-N-acetyl-D-mannosaminuronic acid dehydrogenase